jgi:hypothetical protein
VTDPRMPMIRKCDGSLERFEFHKLRRGVAVAMRDCGYEERLADAIAQAVSLHLRDWRQDRPPSSEYIFRCVRTVLDETGLQEVAQRLMTYRRQRACRRRSLFVFDSRHPDLAAKPWRKSAVVGTLQRRHRLSRMAARILAGQIEERVLSLDYSVISSALVAELIRSELMAWGLSEAGCPHAATAEGAGGCPPGEDV